jgi:hypothetical protein
MNSQRIDILISQLHDLSSDKPDEQFKAAIALSGVNLFSWDNIPGNDNEKLIKFLKHNFGIDWVKAAKIEKINNDKTIRVYIENNSISLKLNNEKTKAIMTIDNSRYEEFIVKMENNKLNIYDEITESNVRIRVMDELVKGLSTEHQALTRAHAAEALGKLGNPKAVLALIDALKDDYQLVRSYAARALGKLGDSTAIEPLVHILGQDPFFGARAEAAEALGKLCKLCKDDNIKASAEDALNRYQEEEKKRYVGKEEDGRSLRVLAEIERSLEQIKNIFSELAKAIKQKNFEDALEKCHMGIVKVEQMGQLSKER